MVSNKRLEVGAIRKRAVCGLVKGGDARLRGRVHDGNLKKGVDVEVRNLVVKIACEAKEQVVSLLNDLLDAAVGAVDLVDNDDHGQVGGKRLAQHEARLGQRAFRSVDEQNDAVDHAQAALDLAAEVRVTRGVDDVDRDATGDRVLAGVVNGGVLREDRDALFAFEVAGVHGPFVDVGVLAKGAALPQHGVHERRLAVVNVGHDRDVAQV